MEFQETKSKNKQVKRVRPHTSVGFIRLAEDENNDQRQRLISRQLRLISRQAAEEENNDQRQRLISRQLSSKGLSTKQSKGKLSSTEKTPDSDRARSKHERKKKKIRPATAPGAASDVLAKPSVHSNLQKKFKGLSQKGNHHNTSETDHNVHQQRFDNDVVFPKRTAWESPSQTGPEIVIEITDTSLEEGSTNDGNYLFG